MDSLTDCPYFSSETLSSVWWGAARAVDTALSYQLANLKRCCVYLIFYHKDWVGQNWQVLTVCLLVVSIWFSLMVLVLSSLDILDQCTLHISMYSSTYLTLLLFVDCMLSRLPSFSAVWIVEVVGRGWKWVIWLACGYPASSASDQLLMGNVMSIDIRS